jgi:hypothetical protein
VERWLDDLMDLGYDVRGWEATEEADAAGKKGKDKAELVASRQKAERARALKEIGENPHPLIDVKADGGYSVGPGSVHKSGHVYTAEGWDRWLERPKFNAGWLPERYRSRHRKKGRLGSDIAYLREIARETEDGGLIVDYDADECSPERRLHRALKYIERCDPAIDGAGGHNQTFFVACRTMVGFDLNAEQAWRVINAYNDTLCQPPWEEWELDHKLEQALSCASEPRGCMLINRPEYEEKKKRERGQAGAIRRVDRLEEVILDDPEDVDEPDENARIATDDGLPLSEDDQIKSKHWAKLGVDWLELKSSGISHYMKQSPNGIFIPADPVNISAIMSVGRSFKGRLLYNELLMRPVLTSST